jgi:hypothetical protein
MTRMRDKINKFFMGMPERKRPLENLWRRWEDNIITDFKEICWRRGLDWSESKWGQQVAGYCA